jgi:hypothetical protein
MQLLGWVISLLPDWSPLAFLPDVIDDVAALPVVAAALGFLSWFNQYAPVAEMFSLLAIAGTALLAIQAYKVVMWVWHNLPGKAT